MVYSTHSPYLIPKEWQSVHCVTMTEEGTKVDNSLSDKELFRFLSSGTTKGFNLYVLAIIAEVVLNTDEEKLSGTKINKVINEDISTYLEIIKKEKAAVRATGVAPKQTWTYTLCNITDITVEEDEEFFDEEDDDE